MLVSSAFSLLLLSAELSLAAPTTSQTNDSLRQKIRRFWPFGREKGAIMVGTAAAALGGSGAMGFSWRNNGNDESSQAISTTWGRPQFQGTQGDNAQPQAPRPAVPNAKAGPDTKVGAMGSMRARIGSQAVICRKYPDVLTSSAASVRVFPSNSPVSIGCWTTASMDTENGKVNGNAIWLKATDFGCYVNDAELAGDQDYQSKLNYCMAPQHWVAGVKKEYKELECYQCPSLKCPVVEKLGAMERVDVQCLVDGEEARGNNTWVRPAGKECLMPAETFMPGSWLGTYGGKC